MKHRKLAVVAALGAALVGGTLATTPALAQHFRGGYGVHAAYGFHGGYGYYHGGYYGGWRGGYYGPGIGLYFGPGFFPGDYYYDGFYGYPGYGYAPAVVQVAPQNYVEQGQTAPAPQSSFWYRCDSANGTYYPYVKDCPGGWTKVPAQAPQ